MDLFQNLLGRLGEEFSIITINNNNLVDVAPSLSNTKHLGACVRILILLVKKGKKITLTIGCQLL